MSKKLSVAIPTWNRLGYLKECLWSVLNQTFHDFSVYVFDNASDEPVEQELQKYKDKRIHFIGSDKNVGFRGNMSRILAYPFESEYLVIFHDDDAMHPQMLELETTFLDGHKDIVFVVSDLHTASDKTIHSFSPLAKGRIPYTVYKNSYQFTRAEMSWLSAGFDSAMYRVKALDGARMKTDQFFHFDDMVFLIEISQKGPCAFMGVPLLNHRIHAKQYSETHNIGYEQGAMRMIPFFRENFPMPFSKSDEKLFRKNSLNFLLRVGAHINNGFFYSVGFLKRCHQQNLIRYQDFRYIDLRGIVSVISIIVGSRKIIDAARWLRNLFRS